MKYFFPILLCCIIFLSGCFAKQNEETPSAKDTVIGYCQLGDESSWRTQNTKSVLTAIENQQGLQVMYQEAKQKQENQIKALRSFIAYQVDIIVFSPIVETGWDTVLQEAQNADIPVIILDRKISTDDDTLFTCFIGSDFTLQGERAGKYVLQKFKRHNDTVSIVELSGTVNSSPAIGRHEGFVNVISSDSKFVITENISGDFMLSRGKEIIRKRLEAHGAEGMDILYSHNDEMTLGAIEEMLNYGISPGEDVVIISVDAQQTMIDNLQNGIINCSIECNPNSGKLLIYSIYNIINEQPIEKYQYLYEQVFTDLNDVSVISSREY